MAQLGLLPFLFLFLSFCSLLVVLLHGTWSRNCQISCWPFLAGFDIITNAILFPLSLLLPLSLQMVDESTNVERT